MLAVPHGAYHLLLDDVWRHRNMTNSDIAPHAGMWKTMMHNKHSSFSVKLTIHDITNVPLVSGSFSVRWKFRGSKGDIDLEPTQPDPTSTAPQAKSRPSSSSLHRTFTAALTSQSPPRSRDPSSAPSGSSGPGGNRGSSPDSSVWPSPAPSSTGTGTGTSTPALGPGPSTSSSSTPLATQSSRSAEGTLINGSTSNETFRSESSAEMISTQTQSLGRQSGARANPFSTGPDHPGLSSRASVRSFNMDKDITSTLLPLPSTAGSGSGSGLNRGGHLNRNSEESTRTSTNGDDPTGDGFKDPNSGRARMHVPHILLHRSGNDSHSSLSSAFSSLGRKRRGNAIGDSGDSNSMNGSAGGGRRQRVSSLASSIDSVPDSVRSNASASASGSGSKSSDSRSKLHRTTSSNVVKLDVPLGTTTTPKGRTPIQELEDHGASWEFHVAQIVRIKLRPMDDEAWAAYAKRVGKDVKPGGVAGGSGSGGLSGTAGGTGKEPHLRAKQIGSNLAASSSSSARQTPSEPAGWLGGGAKSDSGLKLVVYQHLAGMGLETIRSVSTRSGGEDEGEGSEDAEGEAGGNPRRGTISNVLGDDDQAGSIHSRSSTAKPTKRHGNHGHGKNGSHHEHDHPGIYFGELNLDLAEYASEEGRMGRGGVTRRYLLKGGKTNAMIKLTIEMSHYEGESNFITPPLQRGHNVAGITGAMENDIQLEHHLAKLKAPSNSASSSSASLAQSQSSMMSRSHTNQLLRATSTATIPLTSDQSRGRPKKPPESHFVAPEHQHGFNQLYRRGYRNHGHRAVHDALKMGHREHRQGHRSSGAYSGEWSAEQVIDLIFNPLPVNRIDKVTPFTYYAEDAPDDGESVSRVDMDDPRLETASLADSTGTTHEKRSRKFLQVLGEKRHGLRSSHSTLATPRDEASEREKGLGGGTGAGQGKARPRWGRTRTKMNGS